VGGGDNHDNEDEAHLVNKIVDVMRGTKTRDHRK
jgi:hypothetical protein